MDSMKFPIYQIDAFANKTFEGNPAAVCPLDSWLPDELMQSIAAENNLAETAFFMPANDGFDIRWFTPSAEVDLCGHATLASAYVLFDILKFKRQQIDFDSKSGRLTVSRNGEWLVLDFPAQSPEPCDTPNEIIDAFGLDPAECLRNVDYVVIFDEADNISSMNPNLEILKQLDLRAVIISATSQQYDFTARVFAPSLGIPEDPVTGSAYTQLVPYWAGRLKKNEFRVRQESARGGELTCELAGDRVLISGKAVKYLEGSVEIEI